MVQSSIDVDDKERSETLNEVKTNGDDNGNELDDCYESNSTNVMNDRTDDNSYLTFNNELNLAPFSYHGGQIVVPNSTTTIFAGDLAFFVTGHIIFITIITFLMIIIIYYHYHYHNKY